MILQLSIAATAALILVAVCPTKHETSTDGAPHTGSRALLRGMIRTICPNCCEIIDEDGFATTVSMKTNTLIAGDPAAGDRVDVLAEFTGARYLAVSIVKTAR